MLHDCEGQVGFNCLREVRRELAKRVVRVLKRRTQPRQLRLHEQGTLDALDLGLEEQKGRMLDALEVVAAVEDGADQRFDLPPRPRILMTPKYSSLEGR